MESSAKDFLEKYQKMQKLQKKKTARKYVSIEKEKILTELKIVSLQ